METAQDSGATYALPLTDAMARLLNAWSSSAFRSALVTSTGLDLGDTESRCIWQLGGHPELRTTDLARQLDLGLPSISKAVSRLRGRSLVDQSPDSTDARARRLRLTPRGTDVARQLYSAGDRMNQVILRTWTPADVATFTRLAQRYALDAEIFSVALQASITVTATSAVALRRDGPTTLTGVPPQAAAQQA